MKPAPEQFPYAVAAPAVGAAGLMPLLPVILTAGGVSVTVSGLVDSGAAVSVLPRAVGERLGLNWDQQTVPVRLGGSLSGTAAWGVVVTAAVGRFTPVRLAFAWAESDGMPVVLGQMNFFLEFEVCLFRSRGVFEVRPA